MEETSEFRKKSKFLQTRWFSIHKRRRTSQKQRLNEIEIDDEDETNTEEVEEKEDSPEGKLGYNGMSLENKKKRKIALVVGYLGTGYYGLQKQQDLNLPSNLLFLFLLKYLKL